MCLWNPKKFRKPKNFVEGYKVFRPGWEYFSRANGKQARRRCYKSEYSGQIWEFGVPVHARPPKATRFTGSSSLEYPYGIHAFIPRRFSVWQGRPHDYDSPFRHYPNDWIVVKVLLFGVTHKDKVSFRADTAVVIERIDRRTGKRIPWDPKE